MQEAGWLEKLEQLWTTSLRGLRLALADEAAVDLGSANTRVYVAGSGVVLDEPSLIALDAESKWVVAVGGEARALVGREPPSVSVVRPVRGGVIADCEAARRMLESFLERALAHRRPASPGLLLCVSSGLTPLERKAAEEVAARAGAGRFGFIEAPLAAAVVELDWQAAPTSMVVDVGAGKIDVAVISRGAVIYAATERTGADAVNEAVAQYLRRKRGVEAGEGAIEKLKLELGSAWIESSPRAAGGGVVEIGCRNLSTLLPETVRVTSDEIRAAAEPFCALVEQHVRAALEAVPTEASVDLLAAGILLSGGGAQLAGLAGRVAERTGLATRLAAEPMLAAILGAGRLVERTTGGAGDGVGEPGTDAAWAEQPPS
jgi:rod shape-determining protein MreB and related proteins